MQQMLLKWGPRLIWPLILLTIALLLIFSLVRVADILGWLPPPVEGQPGPPPEFNVRYLDHVVLSLWHVITGFIFIILAPLQFSKSWRAKHLVMHRWVGRGLISVALIAAVTGIVMAYELPGFGGFSSTLASWTLGLTIIICLLRALWCAVTRQIALHREWMLRAFAIGLAVGTQRLLISIFMGFQAAPFEEIFAPTLWLGLVLNLIIVETWITLTRLSPRKGNNPS